MTRFDRRAFLAALGAGVAGLAGCAGGAEGDGPVADTTAESLPPATSQPPASGALPSTVTAERKAREFTAPLGVEPIPGTDGSLAVVDQEGRVYRYNGDRIADTPLLDVRDRMVSLNPSYDERGLLGVALHPDYADNGRLYARYSAPRRSGTPSDYSHTFVLAEFVVDGRQAPLSSERTVLEIPQPQGNHNAGAVVFGPEGYLYVAVGDGGGAGDSGPGHVAGGNGQDVTENLLGSVLRIDVDGREGGKGYAVPSSNPLVGQEGLDEHYAWGLRNPWRMSFDGSDLYAADVGQSAYEEVDRVVAGGNYGWRVREGAHCYDAANCPSESPSGRPLRDPVIEYPHSGDEPSGIAVIGGYRYRGTTLAGLQGSYVFADWRFGGSLFVAEPTDAGLWPLSTVGLQRRREGGFGQYLLAFGRGADDELYVCTTDSGGPGGDSGALYELVAAQA